MRIIEKIINHVLRERNYVYFLRKKGITIGENTKISNEYSIIDLNAPCLISIGNNVFLTSGHTILTHDYSRSVIARNSGSVLGFGGPVTIGNNVFVGMHTTILPNTIIEDDIIIGANSLVKGHLKSGYVYAGNPAKKICTLNEYANRREEKQVFEAIELFNSYYKKYNKVPKSSFFTSFDYQWLWEDVTNTNRFKNDFSTKNNDISYIIMHSKKRPFSNYDEFINYANKNIKK